MAAGESLRAEMLGSYVDANEQVESSYLAVDTRTPMAKSPAYLCDPRFNPDLAFCLYTNSRTLCTSNGCFLNFTDLKQR